MEVEGPKVTLRGDEGHETVTSYIVQLAHRQQAGFWVCAAWERSLQEESGDVWVQRAPPEGSKQRHSVVAETGVRSARCFKPRGARVAECLSQKQRHRVQAGNWRWPLFPLTGAQVKQMLTDGFRDEMQGLDCEAGPRQNQMMILDK